MDLSCCSLGNGRRSSETNSWFRVTNSTFILAKNTATPLYSDVRVSSSGCYSDLPKRYANTVTWAIISLLWGFYELRFLLHQRTPDIVRVRMLVVSETHTSYKWHFSEGEAGIIVRRSDTPLARYNPITVSAWQNVQNGFGTRGKQIARQRFVSSLMTSALRSVNRNKPWLA